MEKGSVPELVGVPKSMSSYLVAQTLLIVPQVAVPACPDVATFCVSTILREMRKSRGTELSSPRYSRHTSFGKRHMSVRNMDVFILAGSLVPREVEVLNMNLLRGS